MSLVITLAVELLLMTCIGVFAYRIHLTKADFSSELTKFVMNIALPCLVFHSIISAEFSSDTLRNCAVVLLLAVATGLLSLSIGQIIYILKKRNGSGLIIRYGLTFPHFSFMGIPVISALFGTQGDLYYMIFLIPIRIMYYSLSKELLLPSQSKETKKKVLIKQIVLSPALIAVAVGLVFWITGLHVPTVIDYCISSLSAICSPLGLIICGMTLGAYDFKSLLKPRYFQLPILRTMVMPTIFFALTRLFLFFGVDRTICNINMIVIYSALPIASLTAAYTVQYNPDKNIQFEAAAGVFLSTICAMAMLPLWCFLL